MISSLSLPVLKDHSEVGLAWLLLSMSMGEVSCFDSFVGVYVRRLHMLSAV